jgi:hypothetical protein
MAANFSISIPNFRPSSSVGAVGGAAANVDIAGTQGAVIRAMPKPDELFAQQIANRAAERNAATQIEASNYSTGIDAISNLRSTELIAKANVKAAKKQASAQSSASTMGTIGTVIGAGLSLFSDETMKDSIEEITDALSTLRNLRPVSFHYKEEWSTSPERKHHGFIAQEFKNVLPDATYYDDSKEKYCIDTLDLIGLLVRGIQQLETRVACLEVERALTGVN